MQCFENFGGANAPNDPTWLRVWVQRLGLAVSIKLRLGLGLALPKNYLFFEHGYILHRCFRGL